MNKIALHRSLAAMVAALCVLLLGVLPAHAEQSELRVAKQYGLGYLQMMVLEDQKIVEKNAAAAGLGEVKVTWATFRSSDVMNDALLSGSVDFVCLGIPGLATIWGKTKGGLEVKAASGFNFLPLAAQHAQRQHQVACAISPTRTRSRCPPSRYRCRPSSCRWRRRRPLAMPNYAKLDALTVSMAHPDAMATFLSGGGEINNHFTSPPFIQKELEKPGITKVLNSVDVLGGPDLVQRRRDDQQVLQRKPAALRGIHEIAGRCDRIHQHGQARARPRSTSR